MRDHVQIPLLDISIPLTLIGVIMVIFGVASAIGYMLVADQENRKDQEQREADETAELVEKLKGEARLFIGKTWRVAKATLSMDDDYWYMLLCLYDANGNRELMRVGDGHYSARTFFFLRPGDKVTFAFTESDQAEEDSFEASSFLVPTVVGMDIESLISDDESTAEAV